MRIDLNCGTEVYYYGYRQASLKNAFLTMDRNDPPARRLEEELASRAGVDRDNHVIYEIRNNGGSLFVFCSDMRIVLGTEIEVRHW